MKDPDFCKECQRTVTDEHDFEAHGGLKESAESLAAFKAALKRSGEHHK